MTLFRDKYRIESTRLRGWDYGARGWYFITICSQNRECIFGEIRECEMQLSSVGCVANSELRSLRQHYDNVYVDEHAVMPNHVHAIIMIDGDHCFSPVAKMDMSSLRNQPGFMPPAAGSLSAIVRSYKAGVTRKCRELGFKDAIWQSRFYEHILRGDKVIDAVREYIRNNPVNWGVDRENPFRPGR